MTEEYPRPESRFRDKYPVGGCAGLQRSRGLTQEPPAFVITGQQSGVVDLRMCQQTGPRSCTAIECRNEDSVPAVTSCASEL